MTLVINQLLYQQSLNDEQPIEDHTNITEEVPPEFAMPLWDWCIDSYDEKIEEVFVEYTPIVKFVPKEYKLHRKGQIPIISCSKIGNIPLREITPPLPTSKPNVLTQGKLSGKSDKIVPANTSKTSTSNSVRNNTKLNTVVNNNKICQPKLNQTMNNPNMNDLYYNVIEDMKKKKSNISIFYIF
jgi:hypothetical protein